MVVFFLIALSLLLAPGADLATTYYVKPSGSSDCPSGLPCETLDHYVSNATRYFTDNTVFTFLPGIHSLSSSTEINSVTNVTLHGSSEVYADNPIIKCTDSSGLIFTHSMEIKIAYLSFVSCGQPLPLCIQRDGEIAQAALAFGHVTDLVVDSVSVRQSRGFGLLAHCVHGKLTVKGSVFSYNNGSCGYLGGNAAVEYTNCSQENSANDVLISSSNFIHGGYSGYCYGVNYTGTLATGLMMILSQTNTTVLITDVTMKGNINNLLPQGFGGNFFLHFHNITNYTSNDVTVQASRFIDGESWTGGGISVSMYTAMDESFIGECKNSLLIRNTTISRNKGIIGCGLYVNFQLHSNHSYCPVNVLNVTDCMFENNALIIIHQSKQKFVYLGNGVAVHIINTYPENNLAQHLPGHFKAFFENSSFSNSTALLGKVKRRHQTI